MEGGEDGFVALALGLGAEIRGVGVRLAGKDQQSKARMHRRAQQAVGEFLERR